MIGRLAVFVVALIAAAPPPRAPVDRMVEVRGARMHARIYPGGSRTILLEAGSGFGTDAWDDIAPRLRAATGATVISYDRAGMGRSDELAEPYDIHDEVARAHDLLARLGSDRDIVLVAHSYGGYLIQLYANLYPGDVRGMVYIDANTVAGIDAIGGPAPLAAGRIRANDVPDKTKLQRASLRQSRALVATHETLRRYPPLCGVPVVVIAAGRLPAALKPETRTAIAAAQQGLARATGGRVVVAAESGHFVVRDQPDLVVDAVRDVVARAARGGVTGTLGMPCPGSPVRPIR